MRKILGFSALLLIGSFASVAQTPAPATPARATVIQYEHCLLVALGREYDQVELNYGQRVKGGSKDVVMMQTDQMVRKLRSAVAALNYLSSLGWECIGVSATLPEQTSYLLRRAK